MKKRTIVALLLAVVMLIGSSLGVIAANPTLQADVDDNQVEFTEPNWGDIPVVRPDDDDEEDPYECTETPPIGSGPFTLTWVPTFDFDYHVLAVGMDTVFPVLPPEIGTYHFVGVQDMRNWAAGANSNGWVVTANMTTEFTLVGGTTVLEGAEINLRGVVASGFNLSGDVMTSAELPSNVLGTSTLSYAGPALTIATAGATEGWGRTALSLGEGSDIELDIIDVSRASIGVFQANIDWVLTAGVVAP